MLKDILNQRRAEVEAQIAEVRKQLVPLERELMEIYKAEAAIGYPPLVARQPRSGHTMKEMVITLLRDHFPNGARGYELREAMHSVWGRADIAQSSLSPQLSRLHKEGKIKKQGLIWYMEASDAQVG